MTLGNARGGRVLVGRYKVESLLGQNAVTETFFARVANSLSASDQHAFALKVLRPKCHHLARNFVDLVRTMQWLSLPGTAGVVEIEEGPGPVFAAFAFEEGVDLRRLRKMFVLPDLPMDARLVVLLGRKIAERLGPLHRQGEGPCVHGGLSPGNVLVKPNGEVVLLDCGLAEALHAREAPLTSHWQFASPEQLRGEPASIASDIYALGVLMHFLCYGRTPYDASTPADLEARIALGPPDFPGLHVAVAKSIARMLAYAPADRPKSVAEVARQVSVALLSANASTGLVHTSSVSPANRGVEIPSLAEPEALFAGQGESEESSPAVDGDEMQSSPRPADLPDGVTADDPEVGVVYDDEDDEDKIEVDATGRVTRRRRRRRVRLLTWTNSAFARKVFRYAWVPATLLLAVALCEGYFFARSWRAAKAASAQKDAALFSEQARLEAKKPKLPSVPVLPPGNLVLKVTPPGAAIWLDGYEKGSTPTTILTTLGAHRLVITAPGYRMLRDAVDTTHGALIEREMVPAVFPSTGTVGLNVGCVTEGKYPVFVDGKEIGSLCPIAGIRLDPGKHMVGVFVIPQNRIWSFDREVKADQPHRVQFGY